MKRRLRILILAAVVIAIIAFVMNRRPSQIVLTGMVTTDNVIVSSQIQGRMQELRVKQGDQVKSGQLLAIIRPEQWKADMAFYASGEQQTANQVAQARANVEAAKSDVMQGEADLENARLSFEREDKIFKQGAESPQAHDQARATFDGQKAHVEALRKQAGAAQSALDAMIHQHAAADAQKDKAQVQLGYTEIHSPIDGTVDMRAALQGEVVAAGQAIVTLINPDDLWVRADVEETYIDSVHIGDKMEVKLPSGATRQGEVFYRAVDADYATQRDVSRTKRDIKTFEIRLRCDNSDRSLAVGMTAYVTLNVSR